MLSMLCGPSGVGKTTLLRALLAYEPALQPLITYTTRSPRLLERNHVDYHFLSQEEFQAREFVCPLLHREAWYGIAPEDLAICHETEVLAVLRPDKLAELQHLVPIRMSFYITWPDDQPPQTPEDQVIAAARAHCTYHIRNTPGHLMDAVAQIRLHFHRSRGACPCLPLSPVWTNSIPVTEASNSCGATRIEQP